MSNFSQQQIDEVWAKATIDPFQDKNIYRKDIAGAWIEYSKYGTESPTIQNLYSIDLQQFTS
jgi:hypothetical protein